MTNRTLIALALLVAGTTPVFGAGDKTSGYSFIDKRTGTKVTVDALTPRAAAALPVDLYVVQFDGSSPRIVQLAPSGFALPDTKNIVADAGVFAGAAGVSAVVAGSSGNLICTQVAAIVTCDLLGGLSVSNITLSGATALSFNNGMTGSATIAAAGSGASTANITVATTDTGCSGTNWEFTVSAKLVVQCNGSLIILGNSSLFQYSAKVVDTASCGTATSGATSGSTCYGDVGFIAGLSGTSSVTFGNAYSNSNRVICQVWDVAAPEVLIRPAITAGSISWTSSSSHTYAWHCLGVSGG
jgi:hypothetical protein